MWRRRKSEQEIAGDTLRRAFPLHADTPDDFTTYLERFRELDEKRARSGSISAAEPSHS